MSDLSYSQHRRDFLTYKNKDFKDFKSKNV